MTTRKMIFKNQAELDNFLENHIARAGTIEPFFDGKLVVNMICVGCEHKHHPVNSAVHFDSVNIDDEYNDFIMPLQ